MDVDPLPPDQPPTQSLIATCVEQVFPSVIRQLLSEREHHIAFSDPEGIRRAANVLLFGQIVRSLAASRGIANIPSIADPAQAVRSMPKPAHVPALELLRPFDFADVPVRALGTIYERLLELKPLRRAPWIEEDKSRRKGSGSYYTPAFIVDDILSSTLGPMLDQRIAALSGEPTDTPQQSQRALDYLLDFRVLDPAMGTGHFLTAAIDFIADRVTSFFDQRTGTHAPADHFAALHPAHLKPLILQRCIFGYDIDPFAAALARASLHIHVGSDAVLPAVLEQSLQAGDSIRLLAGDQSQWGTYEAVVGNPPYVDSEWLSKQDPDLRTFARAHFQAARGNWDLYILFVELALRLTRPGGYTAMVTPSRLLAADYASAVQKLILDRTLIACRDYSSVPTFGDATVPVVVTVVQNTPPPPDHRTEFTTLAPNRAPASSVQVPTEQLRELPDGFIGLPLRATEPDLLAAATAPHRLNAIADCFDGATTAEAYRIADVVVDAPTDAPDPKKYLRLVNTGLIDPFELHWGRKPCRYLGLTLTRPIVPRVDLAAISTRRLAQSDHATVVIAGMGARIEAAVAPPGYLCGKSAVLVIPKSNICPFALTAVLNAPFMTEIYRALFGLRALSAASLTIGPRQIARLPMPLPDLLTPAPSPEPVTQSSLDALAGDALLRAASEQHLLSCIGTQRSAALSPADEVLDAVVDAVLRAALLAPHNHTAAPSPEDIPSRSSR